MKTRSIIPIISISLILLSGCASLRNGSGHPDPHSQAVDRQRAEIEHAIHSEDIIQGMTPRQVISSWGSPREVQQAGNGNSGNQRWLYYAGNSRLYGISPVKMIYFENGRVVGWQTAPGR